MPDERIRQYEEQAEEIRACAEGMKDPGAKDTMLRLAESYEQMAARAISAAVHAARWGAAAA
jgi:hypothetical protein